MPTYICPYCGNELEKKPKRKKKCPSCGNPIYIFNDEMKTETEFTFLDFVDRLDWLNITVSELIREKERLSDQFGSKASPNDTLWSVLNQTLDKTYRKKDIYQEMARIAECEGNDPSPYYKEIGSINERNLEKQIHGMKKKSDYWEKEGISYIVTFFTCKDQWVCDRCKYLASKKWKVDELIAELPINCTGEHGCRCWISGRTDILDEYD